MKRTTGEIDATNRTGAMLRPEDAATLAEIAQATPPSSSGDARLIAKLRGEYSAEGLPIGHDPGPSAVRGRAKRVKPGNAMLLNKMGERLAFERAGARLYEALLAKFDAPAVIGEGRGTIDREEIADICEEEHDHFRMLVDSIAELGGDPTALTPDADVAATASCGLPKVLLDPRTTFRQCLEAVLIAELTDNDAWQTLSDLAVDEGHEELADRFRSALAREDEHLATIREWLRAATRSDSEIEA